MKTIKLLFILWVVLPLATFCQTKQDYDLYTIYLNDYHEMEKWNLIDDDDKPIPIVITNTMSDFALTQYDENFEFDIDYVFSREKFRFDPKAYFGLDKFAFWDKDAEDYLFAFDYTGDTHNIPNNSEINKIIEELKSRILESVNLNRSKFKTDFPVKIINKKVVDSQYRYGRRKKEREKFIDYIYLEFSPIVYSAKYALFYINTCHYNTYDIGDELGYLCIFEKVGEDWQRLGLAIVGGDHYGVW